MRFLHWETSLESAGLHSCSCSLQCNGPGSHLNQIRLSCLSTAAWRAGAALSSWRSHPRSDNSGGSLHTTRIVRSRSSAFCECLTARTLWCPLTARIECSRFLNLLENLLFEWIHLHILILTELLTFLIWNFYPMKTHFYPDFCEWHAAVHYCFDWL